MMAKYRLTLLRDDKKPNSLDNVVMIREFNTYGELSDWLDDNRDAIVEKGLSVKIKEVKR